jgi:hypothetical protein
VLERPQSTAPAGSRLRTGALSLFVCGHLVAAAWWSFGVMRLPSTPPATAPRLVEVVRGAVAAVDSLDRTGHVDQFLRAWVQGTAAWQGWEMFRDVPMEVGTLVLEGAVHGDGGRPRWLTEPLVSTLDGDPELMFLQRGTPPCGFRWQGPVPRDREVVRGWVRHRVRVHEQASGDDIVAARLSCRLEGLPPPPGGATPLESRTWVLWSGAP